MDGYNETVAEFLRSQDDREVDLGDTFDIKTSIALVIITFLATQSAEFLKTPLSVCWHSVQRLSVACIVVAGVLALLELIPRNYRLRMTPDEFLKWVDQTKTFYQENGATDPEGSTLERIRSIEIEKLKARFTANSAVNAWKSRLMAWSFYFTMAAVALNLATLVGLSFGQ